MDKSLRSLYTRCTLCPRRCGVNRLAGELGFCRAPAQVKAARAALHFWEEPCLSGSAGSGTVFFSHCTLQCRFCQNREISTGGFGIPITEEQLCEIFLNLQAQGALNINLVTPTHYVPSILTALELARGRGLHLPVVYNSSGYESVETLRLLDGAVDIYLPDLKYFDDQLAQNFSHAPHYFQTAISAIQEMVSQVGLPKLEVDGRMRKGVIIRHLMLPGQLEDTKLLLRAVAERFGDRVMISLMNQYTPTKECCSDPVLSKTVTAEEYREAVEFMEQLGLTQGFLQEGGAVGESFIPSFSLEGLERYCQK